MANGFIMGRRPLVGGGDGLNWVKVYPETSEASAMPMFVIESYLNKVTISPEVASGYICVYWEPSNNEVPEVMLFNLSSLAVGQSAKVTNYLGEHIRIAREGNDTYVFYYGGDFGVNYLYYSPITLPE